MDDLKARYYLYIVTAAFLWGMIALLYNELAAGGLSQMQVVAVRALVSGVLLTGYLAIFDRGALRINWKDCWIFAGTGMLSFVLFNYCYFMSIDLVSVSVSVVLLNTAPIFIMIISAICFHDRITRKKLVALVITITGCILVTGVLSADPAAFSPAGILYGVASGFCYGLYSVFGSLAVRKGYNSITITAYTFLFAALGSLPLCSPAKLFPLLHGKTLLAALAIGALVTLLPFLLFTKGLTRIDSGTASIIATMELVFASLVGLLILGDSFTWGKLVGDLLIIFSVITLNTKLFDKNTVQTGG